MNILVSACLLGVNCRYNEKSILLNELLLKKEIYNFIPICPEQLGGLTTPRTPAEIKNNKVITKNGIDVTLQYKKGAAEVLKLAKLYNCNLAILKERSPSCGCGKIYDGNFNSTLTDGNGITAELLISNNIEVIGESQIKSKL